MLAQYTFNNDKYNVNLNHYNTHIQSSYKITSYKDISDFIDLIRDSVDSNYAIHKRSKFGMIIEWRAHNLLYKLNIKKYRVKDVDLDINEKWHRKILYFILSLLYI